MIFVTVVAGLSALETEIFLGVGRATVAATSDGSNATTTNDFIYVVVVIVV